FARVREGRAANGSTSLVRFRQNQPFLLAQIHIPSGVTLMIRHEPQNINPFGNAVLNASVSPKKFMPKKLVKNEIGRNMTVTSVSAFMMSFVRFEIADRYVSSAPEIRSRRLSLMSWIRTVWS